jgi:hypothetical protein
MGIAGIAAWYWFRVPFVREADRPLTAQEWDFVEVPDVENVNPFTSPFRELLVHERQRFRRVLFGEPLRHGRTEIYFSDSRQPLGEEFWLEGQLHGTWSRLHRSGALAVHGEYRHGKRHGLWEYFTGGGERVCRIHYEEGLPHGKAEGLFENDRSHTVVYQHGRISEVDGRPVDDPLGEAVGKATAANRAVAMAFAEPTLIDFVDTPLKDVADFYSEVCRIGVRLDARAVEARGTSTDTPISLFNRSGTPASAALFFVLEPLDLVAVYRFEQVWITTRQGARTWTDRTGVKALIASPPADLAGANLAALKNALASKARFDFYEVPILDVLAHIERTYRVPIECRESLLVDRRDDPFKQVPITLSVEGVSLEAALSTLCEHLRARLHWASVHKLVLELRPQSPTGP